MVDNELPNLDLDSAAAKLVRQIAQLFQTMSKAQAERLHAMADLSERRAGVEAEAREWFRISGAAMWWQSMFMQMVCDGMSAERTRKTLEQTASAWVVMTSILKYAYALGIRRGMRIQVEQEKRISEANRIAFQELEEAKDADNGESDSDVGG